MEESCLDRLLILQGMIFMQQTQTAHTAHSDISAQILGEKDELASVKNMEKSWPVYFAKKEQPAWKKAMEQKNNITALIK